MPPPRPPFVPAGVKPGLALAVLLFAAACAGRDDGVSPWPAGGTAYTVDQPDALFELPGRLREISGLTAIDDGHAGAVEDEHGRLYVLDVTTGEVRRELDFGPEGDYEGVELVGRRLFALRSDGVVFEVADWQADTLTVRQHRTGLPPGCDAEGLAYEPARQRLLLACKATMAETQQPFKAIFAYDPATGRLQEAPAFTLDVEAFNRSLPDPDALNDDIRTTITPLMDLSGFTLSGLAVHPQTQEVYVLSSVRKAVVVLAPTGEVRGVWALPDALLRQPEGLAFLPNGDLLLASEGGDGVRGTLLRFRYHP